MLFRCLHRTCIMLWLSSAPVALFGECGALWWSGGCRLIHQVEDALHQGVHGVLECALREYQKVFYKVVYPGVRLRVREVNISRLEVWRHADRAFFLAALRVEFHHSGDLLLQKVNDGGSVRLVLDDLRSGSAPLAGKGSDSCDRFGEAHLVVHQVFDVNVRAVSSHDVAGYLCGSFTLGECHVPALDVHCARCRSVAVEVVQPVALEYDAFCRCGYLLELSRVLQASH